MRLSCDGWFLAMLVGSLAVIEGGVDMAEAARFAIRTAGAAGLEDLIGTGGVRVDTCCARGGDDLGEPRDVGGRLPKRVVAGRMTVGMYSKEASSRAAG